MSRCKSKINHVIIPGEDRFDPYALTIKIGDVVQWTNNDTDAHTVVSVDAVNKIGPRGINRVIEPGQSIQLHFCEPGLWIYFCRFHSHLDSFSQPVAPGCGEAGDAVEGIVTPVFTCGTQTILNNFGTPMMGAISIQPRD